MSDSPLSLAVEAVEAGVEALLPSLERVHLVGRELELVVQGEEHRLKPREPTSALCPLDEVRHLGSGLAFREVIDPVTVQGQG